MQLKNTYFLLRHGEALSNVKSVNSSWPETFENPLTDKGISSIRELASRLQTNHAQHGRGVDMIFASDLLRTKQTAEIVSKAIGVPVEYDQRLREIDFGNLNGKAHSYVDGDPRAKEILDEADGESYAEVSERMYDLVEGLEKQFSGKHILLVSHQANLWLLENKLKDISIPEAIASQQPRIARGELREVNV